MSDIFDTLITDRPDINSYYNISDLNRVEEAVKQLAQRMTNEGYYVTAKPKTPTVISEITDPEAPTVKPDEPVISVIKEPWIQSSGTQFIDTGVSVKSTIGFEIDFSLVQTTGEIGIIGGFNYGGYNHNFGSYNGKWITQYGNNAGQQFGASDTNRHLVSQNVTSGVVSMDGQTVVTGLTYYNNTSRTFRICCYNGGTSYPTFWISSMRIYACRFYDNGALIRDFIPTLDDNNVACLYDKVEGKYYYNAGSGSFTYGENVYNPVQYIESTGTQYINTGVIHTSGKNIRLKLLVEYTNTSGTQLMGISGNGGHGIGLYNYGWWEVSSAPAPVVGRIYNIEWEQSNTTSTRYIEGTTTSVTTANLTGYSLPVKLFAAAGTYTSPNVQEYYCYCKLYSAQVYQNDVLVRDFIPVVDASGVALLYDRLNGVAYYNAGSGTFNAGAPIVEEEAPDEEKPEDDYIIPEIDIDPYIWNVYDTPSDKETGRYIGNILTIRQQFARKEINIPNTMEGLNYIGANNIELLLFVVDNLIEEMIQQYRNCNTFKCGERR